jgi:uncharacterized protein
MNVVVLGASDNSSRYSYKATAKLLKFGHTVFPVGIKKTELFGLKIINSKEPLPDIHTITLYIGSGRQKDWYDFILGCKPKRIIFNPGAENDELSKLAEEQGIEVIEDCTLIMLNKEEF